jgi:hypothetical protein
MIDHQPIFETLKKLSITAIHALANGSEDPYELEDYLEHAKRISFAPFYLHKNTRSFPSLDASFAWKFSLPEYTTTKFEDADGNLDYEEMGVIEWLAQSVVTMDDENLKKSHWPQDEFQGSFDELI